MSLLNHILLITFMPNNLSRKKKFINKYLTVGNRQLLPIFIFLLGVFRFAG
jgi:hypothetical protein